MVERYDFSNEVIRDEFDASWVCPDLDSIYINNAPFLYSHGTGSSFELVVNECNVATAVKDANGDPVGSYVSDDVECNSEADNKKLLSRITFKTKMLTKDTYDPNESS